MTVGLETYRSPFSPKIFTHISLTREKYHYDKHDVIVIVPDIRIFKQLTSSFEYITSIYRSTFLPKKKLQKFIRYHGGKQNINFITQFLNYNEKIDQISYNSLISQTIVVREYFWPVLYNSSTHLILLKDIQPTNLLFFKYNS